MKKILHKIDLICKPLIWLSIVLYFVELHLRSENSLSGPRFFIIFERCVASVFILEYVLRVLEDKFHPESTQDFCLHSNGSYITSPIGIIDALSFLPFIVGFFVPVYLLGVVRACRIIRLFKFFRYSRALQLVALGFYRALPELKSMLFCFIIMATLNSALIHEAEKGLQPEKFGQIENCFWYVLVSATTVGYGDMYPESPFGKLIASIFLLIPTLMIYAGIMGIVGAAFTKIITEEIDPNVDPIQKFKEEWDRRHAKPC